MKTYGCSVLLQKWLLLLVLLSVYLSTGVQIYSLSHH